VSLAGGDRPLRTGGRRAALDLWEDDALEVGSIGHGQLKTSMIAGLGGGSVEVQLTWSLAALLGRAVGHGLRSRADHRALLDQSTAVVWPPRRPAVLRRSTRRRPA